MEGKVAKIVRSPELDNAIAELVELMRKPLPLFMKSKGIILNPIESSTQPKHHQASRTDRNLKTVLPIRSPTCLKIPGSNKKGS